MGEAVPEETWYGHQEHQWYGIRCQLTLPGMPMRRWAIQRRLVHIRTWLHEPVRQELGELYDELFEDAHFVSRLELDPGSDMERLGPWLWSLAKCINEGRILPQLLAQMLSFLEAEELPSFEK